ncbi:TIGR02678 family protein [Rhodococcus sp. WMMA185]|uniref:TIGR02678 family protein n=1 Tax=Rhodococcus sp. WMMA185 TaxID=679318 RepID=UPI0008783C23|nr:TIGR02678 family protein [Rhodococcus sp. WMMA185]
MSVHDIPPLARDSYQRAARIILSNHLVTQTYPDRVALPLLRRWATELRDDLSELFGYRLEITETTARLYTVADQLDAGAPAKTATGRTFDRYRYAYLALTLAALGRAGNQITLSELADHVAASASHVAGIELSTERAADRDAFVDAVRWLEVRGAIALADGDAGGWATNPDAGEALYDIDRSVVIALFRPPRALQHLRSVRDLLAGADTEGAGGAVERVADTKEVARRVRRALVSRPVVYASDLDDDERLQLALPRTAADVGLLTGLVPERRREGIAMIDPSGRFSDTRFPGTGTVAQVALLLAGELADRVLDPDAPSGVQLAKPKHHCAALAAQLDGAVPLSGIFGSLAGESGDVQLPPAASEPTLYPLVEDSRIRSVMTSLADRYGRTFAAAWQTDPVGLGDAAVALLERLGLVSTVPGGVLVLPALARYRGVVAHIRDRTPEIDLFHHSSDDSKDATV